MSAITGPTVLIIDDSPMIRKLVRMALGCEGFTVVEAEGGHSALDLVSERAPDLVLQDMILPDISGTDLVRRLRAVPACAKIPILALSGFASMLSVAENRLLGFTDVLSKPIEPSRLVATVRAHLSL